MRLEKREHLPGGLRGGRRFGGGDWRPHGGSDGTAAEGEARSGVDSRGVRVRWYWLKQPERSVFCFVLMIMSPASC